MLEDGDLLSMEVDPNDFQEIKIIGQGGFSQVWLAKDLRSDSLVAIKKITYPIDKKMKRMFLIELKTMIKVSSPYILKLMGFSLGTPFLLITEYMPHGSLHQFRKKSSNRARLTPTIRTSLAAGVAIAMDRLHSSNIIHRDLKSMNILLDNKLMPKICDFGIARFLTEGRSYTRNSGTPNWMAPEIHEGGHYGPEVDVYSYGMVLYELLTDTIPWEGLEAPAIIKKVLLDKEIPRIPNNATVEMKKLIEMCLNRDPASRPTFKTIIRQFENGSVYFAGCDRKEFNSRMNATLKTKKDSEFLPVGSMDDKTNYIDVNAISDPRNYEFLIELKKASKFLHPLQARHFFKLSSKYLRKGADAEIANAVLEAYTLIIQKPEHMKLFLEMKVQHMIQYLDPDLFDNAANILYVLCDRNPSCLDPSFEPIFTEMIKIDSEKTLTLIACYAGSFGILENPWPIVDISVKKASSFIKAGCGAKLLSLLHFLCYNQQTWRDHRYKACVAVFKMTITSTDVDLLTRTYYCMSFYDKKLKPDYGLIIEHLESVDLMDTCLNFLLRIDSLPPLPELIQVLITISLHDQRATYCLLNIAATYEGAKYMLKDQRWLQNGSPTTEHSLRLLLGVLTRPQLRKILSHSKHLPVFIKKLIGNYGSSMITPLSIVFRKLSLTPEFVEALHNNGALKDILMIARDNKTVEIDKGWISMLYVISQHAFAPEYLIVFERLKDLILGKSQLFQMVITLTVKLSEYPLCANKFIDLNLQKVFRSLRKYPEYSEYAEAFLSNLRSAAYF